MIWSKGKTHVHKKKGTVTSASKNRKTIHLYYEYIIKQPKGFLPMRNNNM